MRGSLRALWTCVAALAFPAAVFAQGTIAGVVKDASGAVLPGVSVEAASAALTEKVRIVSTDGSGQYRIVALPPGSYSITFSLQGFNVVKRDGVQLSGTLTATVDADLRVGALQETVTVSGESPIVDVQSARRQQVIDGDVLQAIPTSRSYNSVLQLVPGVVAGNGQVQLRPGMQLFSAHGGNAEDGRLTLDGINTGASRGGAGVSGYVPDVQNTQEISFSISGNLGEAETGGPQMTVVPKSGTNTFAGTFFATGLNEAMQGNNFDDFQRSVLSQPAKIIKLYDIQASAGGPIFKDRMWYFFNHRRVGAADGVGGIFANLHAGDPTKWIYEPDFSKPARNDNVRRILSLRLTTQLTPKNKFVAFWDDQPQCTGSAWPGSDADACFEQSAGYIQGGSQANGFFGAGPNSPETGDYQDNMQRVQQAKFTSTATNKLLLEAGFGTYIAEWGYLERPGSPTRSLIRVLEQQPLRYTSPTGESVTVGANLKYRASNWPRGKIYAHTWNGSASYVTGAHNLKFGYQGAYHRDDDNLFNIITNDQRLSYRVQTLCGNPAQCATIPNQLTMQAGPWTRKARTEYLAFFAQEQWTRDRLTLQGAVRYDRAWSHFPEQVIGPDRFIASAIVVPAAKGVEGYNDISLRSGVAYDVFGTGKTSLKFNIGKYLHPASNSGRYVGTNPSERLETTTNRSWTDANGNWVADCNLMDPASQDLRGGGGDFCGPWSNQTFGQERPSTVYDPSILSGWSVRPNDWQIGVSVQQQLFPRVSAEVGYYRRWWHNYQDVTDNILVGPEDYGTYSVTAPSDPRLPGGGGYVVSGLMNVNENRFGQSQGVVRSIEQFGEYNRHWDGFDVSVQARLAFGLTLQGGTRYRPAFRGHLRHPPAASGVPVHQPVLPRRRADADAVQGTRELRHPEDRRADELHLLEPTRSQPVGHRALSERGDRAVARTQPVRQRRQRVDQRARAERAVRRPGGSGGPAHREDPAVRAHAHESGDGSRQRVQQQRRAGLYQHLPQPDLAHSADGAHRTHRPAERSVRLLTPALCCRWASAGSGRCLLTAHLGLTPLLPRRISPSYKRTIFRVPKMREGRRVV